MSCLNEYLTRVISNCNFDITFMGDRQCAINKWVVRMEPYNKISPSSITPAFKMDYVCSVKHYNNIPEQMKHNFWKYYISSETDANIYQDNRPEKLFQIDENKHIYCLCAIYCIQEQDTYIFVNGETPLRIWINGEIVAMSQYLYHIKPYIFLYKLNKGINTLLVEKTVLMEYSHIKDQAFVIGINPLSSMLAEHNKSFMDEFMVSSIQKAFYIIPDKGFFKKEDMVGVTVMERFNSSGPTDIELDFIDCFGKKVWSIKAKTKQRFLINTDRIPKGVVRLEVHDLEEGDRSGHAYIYRGEFQNDCENLYQLVLEDKCYATEIAEALKIYADIPNTDIGCYKQAPEIMNERMYYFLFEKYSEIYSAVYCNRKAENKNIWNVFKKSALLFQKSNIDGGHIGYGIFLPKNFSFAKNYSLVIMGAYGYAASRYPLPVPYMNKHQFEDSIVLNISSRGDLENDYLYESEMQKLLKHVMEQFHIKRDRVYFIGVCIGSKTAFSMALKMPDFFAGVGLVFGPAIHLTLNPYLPLYERLSNEINEQDMNLLELNEEYIKNVDNLPIYHVALLDDTAGNAAKDLYITSFLNNCSDHCFYGFLHDEFDEIFNSQKFMCKLIKRKKENFPKEICFTSYYRQYNKSYWILLEFRKNMMNPSYLKAGIESEDLITVKADNVRRFSLLLNTIQMGIKHELCIRMNNHKIRIKIEDFAKVTITDISAELSVSIINLSKEQFEKLYYSVSYDRKLGLKQVYLDKCIIIKPDYYQDDRQVFWRKMFRELSNPLSAPIRYYNYNILMENEIDMDDLSSCNFVLVTDARLASPFQKMIFNQAGIEFGTDYLIFKNKKFCGEFFALIKRPNPVNVKYSTMLLLFNNDNMQQILTKEYAGFQYHPMFESDAVIFNKNKHYCYEE